ncbi:MAG: PaaI family thioesterase [Deltaproteobacteria bacterium]|nr:PaaI family thioesterase [Deltaproteobacteria bacterium]
MTPTLEKNTYCFACGAENPHGLHLNVLQDGSTGVKTEFIAARRYCGWSRYLHGGVISLIFDELLGWLSSNLGYDAVTARMEVRYRQPVPLGSRVILKGELERQVRGLLDIRTTASLEDGSVMATGKGRMMILGKQTKRSG